MQFPKLRPDLAMLVPVAVGLLYAGTGGWTAERWNGALAIMGLPTMAAAYSKGYNTLNPNLRMPMRKDQKRDAHGRFVPDEVE